MRADFNHERDVVFLMGSGRLLHNIGTEKEKVRSPYVTEFTEGTVKGNVEDESRLLSGSVVVGRTTSRLDKDLG